MAQKIQAQADPPVKERSDVLLVIALGCGCFGLFGALVLLAILIPNFLHARDVAKYSSRVADEKMLAAAVEEYRVDHGRYPDGLVLLVPKYLTRVPLVAGSDKPYNYQKPALRKSFGDYDISDDGSLNRGTFSNNVACATRHCYVILTPALGVQVVDTAESATTSVPGPGVTPTGVTGDGHATAYLLGDFSRDFDVAYRVSFEPTPTNRSWSLVSLYLIGQNMAGGSLGVEIARGYPHASSLSGMTSTALPGRQQTYHLEAVNCHPCVIELRGARDDVYAFIGGNQIGHWKRDRFTMTDPYVQLNGEVNAIGDRLFARLVPVRVTAQGASISPDKCSHTTQGIAAREEAAQGIVEFFGTRSSNAPTAYVSVVNGEAGCRTAK